MRPALRWAFAASYAAGLFALSSVQRFDVGPSPAGSDKLAHLAAYYFFCGVIWYALAARRQSLRAAVLAAVLASAYGVTDEVHQYFVPGRSADAADWLADATGAFLLTAAIAWSRRKSFLGGEKT